MAEDDWNIRMVRAHDAHKLLSVGDDGFIDWGKIKVGHVDTGVTRHPIFGFDGPGAPWVHFNEGANLLKPGSAPIDPLDYDGNTGHGTRTASIINGVAVAVAGQTPPSEVGIAPRVPLVPVRAVNSVVLSDRDHRANVGNAIKHLVGKGCGVISVSLGHPVFWFGRDGGLGKEIDRAYEKGVIIVAAAGQVVDRIVYPGKYSRSVCVAGVTSQRTRWPKERYAVSEDAIDIWAPAEGVLRADSFAEPGSESVPPNEGADPGTSISSSLSSGAHSGKYSKGTGTSYATAHVAAAAAMWLCHRHRDITDAYAANPFKIVEAFRVLLKETATPLKGFVPVNGTGILDCRALLEATLPDAGALTSKPEADKQWA